MELSVYTDSDWGGDRRTRRSTSGLVVKLGSHVLYAATRFQKSIALSSGEAELAGQVAGIAEGLGVQKVLSEWSIDLILVSHCDSSAARGVLQRAGAGRLKHLSVNFLWVQELVSRRDLTVKWVPRASSLADFLMRGFSRPEYDCLLRLFSAVRPLPACWWLERTGWGGI